MGAATLYNKQKKVLKVNLDRRGQIIGILDVYRYQGAALWDLVQVQERS